MKIASRFLVVVGCIWFLATLRNLLFGAHAAATNLYFSVAYVLDALIPPLVLVLGVVLVLKRKRDTRYAKLAVGASAVLLTFIMISWVALVLQVPLFHPSRLYLALIVFLALLIDAAAFVVVTSRTASTS